MIQDFDRLPDGLTHEADICIIGTGAAGLLLAREFIDTDIRVIMAESGGWAAEDAYQSLNDGEVWGRPFRGLRAGRSRRFGGTTTLWGGQCIPLDPLDFERRPWVPFSGWPIGNDTLAPYYEQARHHLGIARDEEYDTPIWPRFGFPGLAFDPRKLRSTHGVFIRSPNLGKRFRHKIRKAQNLRVLLHASVLRFETDGEGLRVERALLRSINGRRGSIRAKLFVLCTGGIENARLLLLSDRVQPNGLGNQHDLVGRFFQDHPCGLCAAIETASPRFLQDRYNMLYGTAANYLPKMALSEAVQRRERVLNCVGRLTYEYDGETAIQAIKDLAAAARRGQWSDRIFGRMVNVGRGIPSLTHSAWRFAAKGLSPAPKPSRIYLEAFSEQAPDPRNRVTLSHHQDRFGSRRVRVDWRIQELSWRTLTAFAQTVKTEFERLGMGSVRFAPWLESRTVPASVLRDSYHHAGTTRMAEDARSGVVDTNCKVFGIDGLYIAGSSVFATSGAANPTFTIAALTLRLAEELKAELARYRNPIDVSMDGSGRDRVYSRGSAAGRITWDCEV